MGFTYNSSTPTAVTYNGSTVQTITYNGTVVWNYYTSGERTIGGEIVDLTFKGYGRMFVYGYRRDGYQYRVESEFFPLKSNGQEYFLFIRQDDNAAEIEYTTNNLKNYHPEEAANGIMLYWTPSGYNFKYTYNINSADWNYTPSSLLSRSFGTAPVMRFRGFMEPSRLLVKWRTSDSAF